MSKALVAFFRRIELFRSLNEEELTELLRAIRPVGVAAGEVVFREGDAGDGAYAIESGRIEILARGSGDHPVQVAVLGPGDVLGELSLLDGAPRSATARAMDRASLFRLDKSEFDFLRRNLRPVAYKVIRTISLTLCDRLRDTNSRLRTLMSDPPKALAPEPPSTPPRRTTPIRITSARRSDAPAERGLLDKLNFWSNR